MSLPPLGHALGKVLAQISGLGASLARFLDLGAPLEPYHFPYAWPYGFTDSRPGRPPGQIPGSGRPPGTRYFPLAILLKMLTPLMQNICFV